MTVLKKIVAAFLAAASSSVGWNSTLTQYKNLSNSITFTLHSPSHTASSYNKTNGQITSNSFTKALVSRNATFQDPKIRFPENIETIPYEDWIDRNGGRSLVISSENPFPNSTEVEGNSTYTYSNHNNMTLVKRVSDGTHRNKWVMDITDELIGRTGPVHGLYYCPAEIYLIPKRPGSLHYEPPPILKWIPTAYAASPPDEALVVAVGLPYVKMDLKDVWLGCFIDDPNDKSHNIPVWCTIETTALNFWNSEFEVAAPFTWDPKTAQSRNGSPILGQVKYKGEGKGVAMTNIRLARFRVIEAEAENVRIALNHLHWERLRGPSDMTEIKGGID